MAPTIEAQLAAVEEQLEDLEAANKDRLETYSYSWGDAQAKIATEIQETFLKIDKLTTKRRTLRMC